MNVCLPQPCPAQFARPLYISSPRLKLLAAGEMFQSWETGREQPGLVDLCWRLRGDTKLSSGQNLLGGGGPAGD